MEQILLVNSTCKVIVLPKEAISAIMMFFKNRKVIVRSLNGETNFFDVDAGVL